MSKPSLLAWEQGVDNRLNTSVDQLLKDLVGDTEQGDRAVAVWVLYRFVWLWDRNYKCSSSDFGNFELAQAGRRSYSYKASKIKITDALLRNKGS